MLALELKNVSYKYPGTKDWVLRNINLKISKGSFTILAGPSGCGKTTLLMLARGFFKEIGGVFKGKIFIDGKNLAKQSIAALGNKIAIIFQNPALQLHQLRVIDKVMSAPMYQGLPYQECQNRARKLINEILGPNFYNRSPNELSSGEQQKTALAAALSMKADVLLLDEPFSFLDTTSDKEVLEIILRLHKQGKTIFIATHDLEEVVSYATQVVLLDKGGVVLDGPAKEVLYHQSFNSILPTPLSIRAARALRLESRPLSWQELLSILQLKNKKAKELAKEPKSKKTILSLNNISYRYPETKKGVNNINLEIFDQEILGIIGPNGSGKTTLAKLILGLLKPNKGRVYLNKKEITKLDVSQRAKTIGFVTQDPMDMFFEINIWDEVAAGPKFLGLSEPKKRAEKVLKELNLENTRKSILTLSLVEKKAFWEWLIS